MRTNLQKKTFFNCEQGNNLICAKLHACRTEIVFPSKNQEIEIQTSKGIESLPQTKNVAPFFLRNLIFQT